MKNRGLILCIVGWVFGKKGSHCITSCSPCRPDTDDIYVTAKHVRRYTQPEVSDTESSEDEDEQPEGEDSDDDDDISTTGSTSRSWCTIS